MSELHTHEGTDGSAFIAELQEKSLDWHRVRNDPVLYDAARAGDSIKDVLDVCRRHQVELHPTILVSTVSCITLEGWQYELDPDLEIMQAVQQTLDRMQSYKKYLDMADRSFSGWDRVVQ